MDSYCSQDEEQLIEDASFSEANRPFLGENRHLQRRFFGLVKDGACTEVAEMLNENLQNSSLNINCLDTCGRSAVELATIRGNQEMVETLLRHGASLEDSLLYAVDLEKEDVVTTLLSYTLTGSSEYSAEKGTPRESLFPPHVTPVLLAAHRNNYNILNLLLERQFPHPSIGGINSSTDPAVMLDYYRAVTSPSYILLTSQDPFETAFNLKEELNSVTSCLETEREKFQELSVRLEEFTAELISFARCPDEVMTVLNAGDNMEDIRGVRMRQLQRAIDVGHKKFVTHHKCQELLNLLFYRHHPYILYSPRWTKFLAIWLPTVLTPVLAILYMFIPKTSLGKAITSPFVKFSMKLWSWLLFSTTMLFINGDLGELGLSGRSEGWAKTVAYLTYFCLVIGTLWEDIKKIWTGSVDAFNKWDLLTLMCHMSVLGCYAGSYGAFPKDPNLVSEGNPFYIADHLLAIAVILSFARYMSMLMFSETIGPLLLSLYKMVGDIFKFIIVLLIIIIGVACALQRLYSRPKMDSDCLVEYSQAVQQHLRSNNTSLNVTVYDFCYRGEFAELHRSIFYLFLTLYGQFELSDLDVTSPELSDLDVTSPKAVQFPVATIWLSKIIFIVYVATSIIVLLNMLIAMMSDSYSSVQSDAEVEWRFARSHEMLKYIPKGRTLPPPFNIIPSPKSVWSFLKWPILICSCQDTTKEDEVALKLELDKYMLTVDRLITRYLLAYSLHRDQTTEN